MPRVNSVVEYSFSSRTLTCVSTGGPATTVTWSRDNVLISESQSTRGQQLTDISTATYHNLLTITSSNIRDYSGSFSCNVSNHRGSDTQNVTLNRKFADLSFFIFFYCPIIISSAINITGNKFYELGSITNLLCSTPVEVQTIQWIAVDDSNRVVRQSMTAVQLILNVSVTDSSNNTRYICRVMNEEYTGMSDAIVINVGGTLLYLSMLICLHCDEVDATP